MRRDMYPEFSLPSGGWDDDFDYAPAAWIARQTRSGVAGMST
jgi:hypothetical protein